LDPDAVARRALAAMHEPVCYRPVETDGAARAALRIAQVLDNRGVGAMRSPCACAQVSRARRACLRARAVAPTAPDRPDPSRPSARRWQGPDSFDQSF
jgi:hypothetical protein